MDVARNTASLRPKHKHALWSLAFGAFSMLCYIARMELGRYDFEYPPDRTLVGVISTVLALCQICGEVALFLGVAALAHKRWLGAAGVILGLFSSTMVYPFFSAVFLPTPDVYLGHGYNSGDSAFQRTMTTLAGNHAGGLLLKIIFRPEFRPELCGSRSTVARVKGDQRTLSIALETYYLDHGAYPAWSADLTRNAFRGLKDKQHHYAHLPTFLMPDGNAPATLTTPMAYLADYPKDHFALARHATFCYWHNGTRSTSATGYIIWSAGRDMQFDLTMDNVAQAYDPASRQIPSPLLLELTYDPSNGTDSRGDVYRFKQ